MPTHLSAIISDVMRLAVLKEAGATFAYPDTLTPLQWAGLEALTYARQRDNEKRAEPQPEEQKRQIPVAHLASLSHGRPI